MSSNLCINLVSLAEKLILALGISFPRVCDKILEIAEKIVNLFKRIEDRKDRKEQKEHEKEIDDVVDNGTMEDLLNLKKN